MKHISIRRLHINVCGSFNCKSQEVQTIQMLINRWMGKQIMLYLCSKQISIYRIYYSKNKTWSIYQKYFLIKTPILVPYWKFFEKLGIEDCVGRLMVLNWAGGIGLSDTCKNGGISLWKHLLLVLSLWGSLLQSSLVFLWILVFFCFLSLVRANMIN